MRSITLTIFSAAALPIAAQSGVSDAVRSADDALVLRAVIEHTIVPAVRRSFGNKPATVVLIVNRTSSLCGNRAAAETPCRVPDHWQQFLVPNPKVGWRGLIDNEQRRRQLVESLEARNAASEAVPSIDHPAVVLIPSEGIQKAQRQYRDRTVGFAKLALPGYSSDGYALTYGSYSCGNLCGYGWLFVLQKVNDYWQVRSATITVIS
jgi:hypothetical protein